MSLVRRGREVVTVFPEESYTDSDGNAVVRASSVGVVVRASVQPLAASESQQDGGVLTSNSYRLRLAGYPSALGAQSQVEWLGKRYSISGEPKRFNGSAATQRFEYVMVRS